MGEFGGRRAVGALAIVVLSGGGMSACGDEDPFAEEEEIGAPIRGGLDNEDVLADPGTVIEGLNTIKGMINELVPKIGSEDALYDNEALLPIWEDVEGRVKAEDAQAHQRLEAAFLALTDAVEKNDKPAGRTAADTVIREIDAYLARPRTAAPSAGPTSIPMPSSISTPSSTPEPSSTPQPSSTPTFTAVVTPSSTPTSAAG